MVLPAPCCSDRSPITLRLPLSCTATAITPQASGQWVHKTTGGTTSREKRATELRLVGRHLKHQRRRARREVYIHRRESAMGRGGNLLGGGCWLRLLVQVAAVGPRGLACRGPVGGGGYALSSQRKTRRQQQQIRHGNAPSSRGSFGGSPQQHTTCKHPPPSTPVNPTHP